MFDANKILKVFAALMSTSIIAGTGAFAADLSIDSVSVDHGKMLVTVSGKADEGSRVSLKVVRPDAVTVEHFAQTEADEDSKYEFKFILGDGAVEDKLYGVYVFSDSASKKAVSGFKYFNIQVVANALSALNNASLSDIGKTIEEKNDIFGLPIGVGSDFYSLNNKMPVYTELCGKNFKDLDTLREAFKAAVDDERAAEETEARKKAALEAVNAASADEMEQVLGEVAEILEIDNNTKSFNSLSIKAKNEI